MATFSVDIPDDQVDRVVNAICTAGGYQAEIADETGALVANPQNPTEYARQRVISFMLATVTAVEAEAAVAAARQQAIDAVNTQVAIS